MIHTPGIHHVTAIAGDAQRNHDFYAGALGLRLVKRTVNFDDPSTYHLYFGDELGRPGTIVTFFPWENAGRGRVGTGQIATLSLAIPPASTGAWIERLISRGIAYSGPTPRFDEQVISFRDPDGMMVELVAHPLAAKMPGWGGGSVDAAHSIRGVHAVTLWEDEHETTARFLTETMGFRAAGEHGRTRRFVTGDGGPGSIVDVRDARGFWQGAMGVGTIHHVAFRALDDADQLAMRDALTAAGTPTTGVRDREYFHSIYFHEPGGALFEIATDPPGFAVDEPVASLGASLKLPPWLEASRAQIEATLPELHTESEVRHG
jgi:catechol 2,3-dioxygenase-like lactoylglutathione lyase family enzyme